MIGIDRVQEYLDLIYKASVLSRSSNGATPLWKSRRTSETSQNGPSTAGLIAEIERVKNYEVERVESNLYKVIE